MSVFAIRLAIILQLFVGNCCDLAAREAPRQATSSRGASASQSQGSANSQSPYEQERARHSEMLKEASKEETPPDRRQKLVEQILRESNDHDLLAESWALLGETQVHYGEFRSALHSFERFKEYAESLESNWMQFRASFHCARVLMELGELTKAELECQKTILIAKRDDDPRINLGAAYVLMASISEDLGKETVAVAFNRNAYEWASVNSEVTVMIATSCNLASSLIDMGHYDASQEWLSKAKKVAEHLDDVEIRFLMRIVEFNWSVAQNAQIDIESLCDFIQQHQSLVSHEAICSAQVIRAAAERNAGNFEQSIELYRNALDDFKDFPRQLAETRLGLISCYLQSDQLELAREELTKVDPNACTPRRRIELAEAETRLAMKSGNPLQAMQAFEEFLSQFNQNRSRQFQQDMASFMAEIDLLEKERQLERIRREQIAASVLAEQKSLLAEHLTQRAANDREVRNVVIGSSLVAVFAIAGMLRVNSSRRLALKLNEQQAILNEQLQLKLEEKSRALQREMQEKTELGMAMQLQLRNEAIAKLTGGVAHDFNNLLTVIVNANEVLRLKGTRHSGSIDMEMLEASDRAAKTGAGIVRSLLMYARQQKLSETIFSVSQYLESSRTLFRTLLGDSIQLIEQYSIDQECISVDQAQLTTSILNLLNNAKDAMSGRGTVVLRASPFRMNDGENRSWPTLPDGDYIQISVVDEGAGVSDESLLKAFEPFYSTKTKESGTGLGLSVVYGFVRQSRGDIRMERNPQGNGTIVSLVLPTVDVVKNLSTPTATTLPTKGRSVLLVDDNELVRRTVARMLQVIGFEVTVAENAIEARNHLSSSTAIELMIADINMPGGMDGRELAKWARGEFPNLQIILMTGFDDRENDAIDFPVLSKPCSMSSLMQAVGKVG